LAPFRDAPWHHYILRSVDAPDEAFVPPGAEIITATGPFTLDAERALLEQHGIEIIVTKNSGGHATAAKLLAARERGIPVVMMERPVPPAIRTVPDAESAMEWLEGLVADRGQGGAAPLGPPLGG